MSNGLDFSYLPEKDAKACKAFEEFMRRDPWQAFNSVKRMLTPEVCIELVNEKGFYVSLDDIPDVCRTEEVCFEAVKKHGYMLQYVPWKARTEKVCLAAVENDGTALEYIGGSLSDNFKISLAAVRQNGLALEFSNARYNSSHSRELCLEAVRQNGLALRYVPEKERDLEMCKAAVKTDITDDEVLDFIPDDIRKGAETVRQFLDMYPD